MIFISFIKKDQHKSGYTTTRYKRIQGAPDGSVFVLGDYANTLDPDNMNIPSANSDIYGCFIIKFDKTGNVAWKDTLGPVSFLDVNGKVKKNQRLAVDLALDPDGNPVILTKYFWGETVYEPYKNYRNYMEYELVRFDKDNGTKTDEKRFLVVESLSNYLTYIYRIAIDKANNTYVALEARNNTFLRLDDKSFAGTGKNLIKFNADFNSVWVSNISQFDETHEIAEIATDDSCNVYINARSYTKGVDGAQGKAGIIVSKDDSSGTVRWQNNFTGINKYRYVSSCRNCCHRQCGLCQCLS